MHAYMHACLLAYNMHACMHAYTYIFTCGAMPQIELKVATAMNPNANHGTPLPAWVSVAAFGGGRSRADTQAEAQAHMQTD